MGECPGVVLLVSQLPNDHRLWSITDDLTYSIPPRWESAREWDDQYLNYQSIMNYVNSHPELGVDLQWGTLRKNGGTVC